MLLKKDVNDKQYWWVPINYASSSKAIFDETQPSVWLDNLGNKIVNLPVDIAEDEWLIVNKQQTGI